MSINKRIRVCVAALFAVSIMFAMAVSVSANPSGAYDIETRMIMTPTISLNVRNAPGNSGKVIGSIEPGEEVTVADRNNSWFLVVYEDQGAFVYADYMAYVRNEDGQYNEILAEQYPGAKPHKSGNEGTTVESEEEMEAETGTKVERLDLKMMATMNVNMRTNPSMKSAVVDVLEKDLDIHVTGKTVNGYWYECQYEGRTVYIHDDYLIPEFPQTMEASHWVNVRTTPDTSQKTVGVLEKGTKIKVSGEENGWFRFTYEETGKAGYVYSAYIRAVA